MNRPLDIASRPQVALQSYLDALLQDATDEVPLDTALDEFEAAVQEEKARDAQLQARPRPVERARQAPVPARAPVLLAEPVAKLAPVIAPPMLPTLPVAEPEPVAMPLPVEPPAAKVEPVVELHPRLAGTPPPPLNTDSRPSWGEEPFECLLFDVAGLTLAVPLVCLGSIYTLAGQELTPLFGQPDWFLGILPCQAGNLKVLDTARWIMPDRYREDFRQGLQYVISVQGYEWGLAVHQVSRSLRLDPQEIKWRTQRGQRPWLAGTVIEHMCALLDVSQLAELIASGAVKHLNHR